MAQLVEYDLAKVGVAGSSPVSRSEKKGVWKNSIEFFRISLFAIIVYKWLKSYAKKAQFPYPIEILF